MKAAEIKEVTLGGQLTLDEFMAVVRFGAKVRFSEEYVERVDSCRRLVEKWVAEERVMYGTTTGFGSNVKYIIPEDEAEKLQRNIVLTHSTSVGEPLDKESVRGLMLITLNSLGRGLSGVRMKLLELYRDMLNADIVPCVPAHGSVGYLTLEAQTAMVAIGGEGSHAWYQGKFMGGREALEAAGLKPITLSYKEGLALTNGTITPTAFSAIAIYNLRNAVKTADVIASISVEALGGLVKAYDPRIMEARPQKEQIHTAENLRRMLEGSGYIEKAAVTHVQDALSLRCIPQAHGAVKHTLESARQMVETELNVCCDNPIFVHEGDDGTALSNGNPDAAYEGLEMDSCCIAATYVAKMSERRNTRFIDSNLSGFPAYLVANPGLNSGLMIPQYTQAGLLNEMRMYASPASIDLVTTSGNQEDYVSMGFNACRKAQKSADTLEYILAIELLSGYTAQQFLDPDLAHGRGTGAALDLVAKNIPMMKEDMYIYPSIEKLRELIHTGKLAEAAESTVGELAMV